MQINFRPNDEFDEAALYTTDVWLREEDFDEDAPAPPYAPAVVIEQEVATVQLPIQPAVSAFQAASEGEIPLAVSAPQAAPEWEGSLELDWDAIDIPQASVFSRQGRQPRRSAWNL
jgi:hypothetical protein